MIDIFAQLISELSATLQMPLSPDKLGAVSIQMDSLTIQLELDPSQEFLFIFAKLGEVGPGKFRENIFIECLKLNGFPGQRPGIFGFIARTNHLALYQRLEISTLRGETLEKHFADFVQFAEPWVKELAQGRFPISARNDSKMLPGIRL